VVSAGVHPFGLDHGDGRQAHQVGDERLGRLRFVAVAGDAYGVDNFALIGKPAFCVPINEPEGLAGRRQDAARGPSREKGTARPPG